MVITGFGKKETFPTLTSFACEIAVNNKLKYKETNNVDLSKTSSAIIPFAQGDMVCTFMEGVDPNYIKTFDGYLSELFDKYPEQIAAGISQLNDGEKNQLTEKLRGFGHYLLKDCFAKMIDYRKQNHIDPIIFAISVLPKDELAAMAESLVHLTSLKRRISMDAETVGGPIDVAVISKGDGFVWIKRKHYFRPELNPFFLANYFNQ